LEQVHLFVDWQELGHVVFQYKFGGRMIRANYNSAMQDEKHSRNNSRVSLALYSPVLLGMSGGISMGLGGPIIDRANLNSDRLGLVLGLILVGCGLAALLIGFRVMHSFVCGQRSASSSEPESRNTLSPNDYPPL
jgi:sugar phosphate permease